MSTITVRRSTIHFVLGNANHFSRDLITWYSRHRRAMPWRVPLATLPDPYHVLVSELMLQQTQVVTVIPYFHRFIAEFPTIAHLADADEQRVLRLWQGLGYYSRARNLQRAARAVVEGFNGHIPREVDALLTLPGVGRYTAGAIASLAFDARAPIVDGNVARVLCRIDKITSDPRERTTLQAIWKRAEALLPETRPGDFNSGLMELGATICTPRTPQCLICPVANHCEAREAGLQETIPLIRKAKATPIIQRQVWCIKWENRWLIEQRPPTGRWAGMWQFVTIDPAAIQNISRHVGIKLTRRKSLGTIRHALTHRRYEFDVQVTGAASDGGKVSGDRRWITLEAIDAYPLPRPHVRIARMLDDLP